MTPPFLGYVVEVAIPLCSIVYTMIMCDTYRVTAQEVAAQNETFCRPKNDTAPANSSRLKDVVEISHIVHAEYPPLNDVE